MLLVEPTRTNLIPRSVFVDDNTNNIPDGWSDNGNGSAAGTDYFVIGGAPDGWKKFVLADTAFSGRGCLYSGVPILLGTVYCESAWVQRTAASVDRLYGVNVGGVFIRPTLPNAITQWQRISDSTTGLGNHPTQPDYILTSDDPSGSVDIALPQLEAGKYASTWIPTTATSEARPAESCAISPSLVSFTSGSIQFDWSPGYASTVALATGEDVLWTWDGSSPGVHFIEYRSTTRTIRVYNNAIRAESGPLTFGAFDTVFTIRCKYGSFGTVLTINGSSSVDTNAWTVPSAQIPGLGNYAGYTESKAYGNLHIIKY